jgi:hypothetical protein
MTLKAFNVGGNYGADWLQPTKGGADQSAAGFLARTLARLNSLGSWIGRARAAAHALPRECAELMMEDDVARARQLLLGIERNSDDYASGATAASQGTVGPHGDGSSGTVALG